MTSCFLQLYFIIFLIMVFCYTNCVKKRFYIFVIFFSLSDRSMLLCGMFSFNPEGIEDCFWWGYHSHFNSKETHSKKKNRIKMYKLLFDYVKHLPWPRNCPFLSESIWNATATPRPLRMKQFKIWKKKVLQPCPQNSVKFTKNVS